MARYYVGPLNYSRLEQNKYKEKGKFSNFGANRYSLNHADSVEYAKSQFSSSTENDALGKMFEGFFYPLVRCGFFDLRGQNRDGAILPSQYGAVIVPSEYDDIYKNKVDFAAVVPMVVEGGEGEKTLVHQPISFALTVSTDFRKADKIKKEFFSKKGLSEMEYPSTCLGNAIPPMKNIPYFVIRLEKKTELNSYMKSLAEGRVPTKEIRRVIYFQIYRQAKHWANYWKNRRDLDNYSAAKDNTIRQFKRIAGWSLRRMDMAPDAREKVIQRLVRDHPQLTYLDKL